MPIDEDDWKRVLKDLYGNGKPGIVEEVKTMRRALYRNPDTGEAGLVADVSEIKRLVIQARGGWWLIGGAIVIIQLLTALGAFQKA